MKVVMTEHCRRIPKTYFFLFFSAIKINNNSFCFDNVWLESRSFQLNIECLLPCRPHPSGGANYDQWHGEHSERYLPGCGARHLDQAGLPLPVWPNLVVHGPPGQDQGAGSLVSWLRPTLCSVAGWLLQPAVFPHSHHASYGSKVGPLCLRISRLKHDRWGLTVNFPVCGWQERVASWSHVSAVRRHQEESRGLLRAASGRGLRIWAVHGGCTLGHTGTFIYSFTDWQR